MKQQSRKFLASPAVRKQVPLLIGLVSPSGGGKTRSALRLATGIQRVCGGEIFGIDTEANRMLHHADSFKFKHVPFSAPFSSLDYLAALEFCANEASKVPGKSTIIVDQISSEHDGVGGMLDFQEAEMERLSKGDSDKRDRVKMLAWTKPKQARRALINGILQMDCNFIFNFRTKHTSKPIKVNNKTEIEPQGFVPIAGEEFVYEMTMCALMLPKADGYPTWSSEFPGERLAMKLPEWFRPILLTNRGEPKQLDENIGEQLARWAAGGIATPPTVAEYEAAGPEEFEELERRRAATWADLGRLKQQTIIKTAADAAKARIVASKQAQKTEPVNMDAEPVDEEVPYGTGEEGLDEFKL